MFNQLSFKLKAIYLMRYRSIILEQVSHSIGYSRMKKI